MGRTPEKTPATTAECGCRTGRSYANDLRVELSLSECWLDFAQNFGPDDVHIQSRLITSPTVLAEFHSVIDGALEDYEARYGKIPQRPGRGGK